MEGSVILIADDDESDVFLLERAFQKANVGVRVMVVPNGEEAIGYLSGEGKYRDRNEYRWPVLMLLDLKMPMVSGFEVLTWWREHGKKRNLPIIIMSTSNHEADIKRAMALGAVAYRVKPSDFEYLVAVAEELREWLTQQEMIR